MSTSSGSARDHLDPLGIEHASLSHADVVTMSYTLHGWQIVPRTPAHAPPIIARVWLLATLNTRGRYVALERPGHAADLQDGDRLVDSVILMAIIQRHFMARLQPAWDDATLASHLGLDAHDITRAQPVLDHVEALPLRPSRPAPLGKHWWSAHANARSERRF